MLSSNASRAVVKKINKIKSNTRDISDVDFTVCCIFAAINRLSLSRCADKICLCHFTLRPELQCMHLYLSAMSEHQTVDTAKPLATATPTTHITLFTAFMCKCLTKVYSFAHGKAATAANNIQTKRKPFRTSDVNFEKFVCVKVNAHKYESFRMRRMHLNEVKSFVNAILFLHRGE